MMQQYLRFKGEHPDRLLFYRMGDFYELFYADAERASRAARHHADRARPVGGRADPDGRGPVSRAGAAISQRLLERRRDRGDLDQIGDPATSKGPVERRSRASSRRAP